MKCPECGGRTICYATKPVGALKQRYRRCPGCGYRFSTWEQIEDRDLRDYDGKAGDAAGGAAGRERLNRKP